MANIMSQPSAAITLLIVTFYAITPTAESLCSDVMATFLSSSGFTIFAHALHAHNLGATNASATRLTFLAPPDSSLINKFLNNETLNAHITSAAGAFPYQSLLALPPNATLPTLHHNTTLVVGSDGQEVFFNDVLVVVPNLYFDGSCAVHGVDGPLVPIPSGVDDSVEPRNEPWPSPLARSRRQARQISQHVRFIRRASHPNLDDDDEVSP